MAAPTALLKMGHEKFTKFEFADGYDVSQELVKNDTVQVVVSDGGGRADGGGAAGERRPEAHRQTAQPAGPGEAQGEDEGRRQIAV